MAPYTPNAWVNDGPPALSAAHLNKICDELALQASETSISHSLPTWVNDASPALTDSVPLNEMERVAYEVGITQSLGYTVTTWLSGWRPSRNATNLNKLEAQLVANRTAIDSSVTSGFTGNGQTLINYVVPPPSAAAMANFSCVVLHPINYAYVAQIKAVNPTCKVFLYQAAGDLLDIGIGRVTPTWAQHRDAAYTTVTLNEAWAWDDANPSDQWVMTSNGSTEIGFGGYPQRLGNFGKATFRTRWRANIATRFANQPLWDGAFLDNCIIQNSFDPVPAGGWPVELPSQTAWTNALKGFLQDVCPYMRTSLGKMSIINANYTVTGDANNTNAVGVTGWWNSIGANIVDVIFSEYHFQAHWIPANKAEGSAQADYWWQNWYPLVNVAEALNSEIICSANLGLDAENPSGTHARYTRASAFLEWDGSGLYAGYHTNTASSPWAGGISYNLGTPVGSIVTTDSVRMRQATGGWVAVNPTLGSKTVSVGGTPRTIAARDAYIGV